MSNSKWAQTTHPIQPLLAQRWSPYVFADRAVAAVDLRSLFEAARWAASSYNEQPWRYIVATRDDASNHARVLECLVEGNRKWAATVPVLALGVVSLKFSRNGKPNVAAHHDLGQASANLTVEATARGLAVHQMIGILPDLAREIFAIPEGFAAFTGLAIGYPGDATAADESLRQRDLAPRQRLALDEFVFAGGWGRSAKLA